MKHPPHGFARRHKAIQAPTAICGRYLWLFWDIGHGLTPQNARKIVNRKTNEIIDLLKPSYASARFPTATYCTENERTPKKASTCQKLAGVQLTRFQAPLLRWACSMVEAILPRWLPRQKTGVAPPSCI